MLKVGVVFSGSGFYDGSDIQEAVITLLALDRSGVTTLCMAPDIDQMHVVNHLTGKAVEGEKRNVLIEAARIARGKIQDIKNVGADDIDALIFPGGFGAAKNLSDFAVKGAECSVNGEVERLVKEMVDAKKPVGIACITPVIASRIYRNSGRNIKITIGDDKETADALISMGSEHINCPVKEFVVDKENKMVSTPAYMMNASISEVAEGIEKMVQEVLKLI